MGQSYHDLFVTTKDIPRTRLFDLPYGYEVTCQRTTGWQLWDNTDGIAKLVASEFPMLADMGLLLDVDGRTIVDSLPEGLWRKVMNQAESRLYHFGEEPTPVCVVEIFGEEPIPVCVVEIDPEEIHIATAAAALEG